MTTDKTAVALRVLMAFNNRETPTEKDVLLLQSYCPADRDLSPDELACIVIQEMYVQRKKARDNKADGKPATP